MNLDAERAADVLADHANLRILKPQVQSRDVLHHVRRLRALINRHPSFSLVPVGEDRARLQCRAGVPAKDEIRFHHLFGVGEGSIDSSRIEVSFECEIVAERGMDDRALRIERRAHIRDRLQLLVFNRNDFSRILGDGATIRHDSRDRLALPAGTLDS